MRTLYCLAYFGAMASTLALTARGQGGEGAKPLVDRILNAHGGEAKLAAVNAFVEKTKSKAASGSITTLDRYIQLPNQNRQQSEFDVGNKRVKCVLVFAADNGWKKLDDQPTENYRAAYKDKKDPLKYAGPRAWLRLLDPAYKVTSLGEDKVNDRPTFAILVSLASDPPEKLLFDKVTGLLLKEERTFRYADGRTELHETFYADYQGVQGIPIARKITKSLNGKTIQQIEVTEFRIVDKLDAKLFEKP